MLETFIFNRNIPFIENIRLDSIQTTKIKKIKGCDIKWKTLLEKWNLVKNLLLFSMNFFLKRC
ncbi:MAG: hypothetical protein KAI20_05650, partial [Thermoplasmatales archaeon]|nr:hypothetical protein [Thermoplasmatales archaeon]